MAAFTAESTTPSTDQISVVPGATPTITQLGLNVHIDVANTAPAVATFVPTPPTSIVRATHVTFNVTDADSGGAFTLVEVYALYGGGTAELVYDGSAFVGAYASSVRSGIANGYHFEVFRTGGWLSTSVTVAVKVVDAQGALGTGTAAYTITNPVAVADTVAPTVVNFVPAVGAEISSQQAVTFDVLDDSGAFRKVFVTATFARTGVEEVVYDGTTFRGLYSTMSLTGIITDGLRFTVARFGGWPSSPDIRVFAIDSAGNEGDA